VIPALPLVWLLAASPLPVVREAFLMGTTLRAEVTGDRSLATAAIQQAFDTVAALELVLSTWREDSEIAALNRARPGEAVPLSRELGGLLAEVERWWHQTGGAFDPAVGALVDAWDLRGKGRVPGATSLARARSATGFEHFVVQQGDAGTIAWRDTSGGWLDTGGFGKGAALRAATAKLRVAGIASASLNFGGQVAVFGAGPERGRWLIPVAHPAHRHRPVASLRVADASVSTSAQSERYVAVNGTRYGHILDPRTGRPVPPWGSVTVVHRDPLAADVLSTALFVLGPEAGAAYARQHGIAALFLVQRGGGLQSIVTPALRPLLAGSPLPSLGG
jgi:thiamine biosynthesis lipoprotein